MGWILRVQLDTTTLDLASAVLWDAGTSGIAHLDDGPTGTSGASGVVAGFDTEAEASAAVDRLRSSLGSDALVAASIEAVDPAAWVDPERRVAATVAGHELILAPGAAFGDGGHPTTRLALGLLASLDVADAVRGRPVVDFGAGTGILSLAALASGATEVMAVENDPDAIQALRTTLALNPALTEGRRVEVVTELPAAPRPAAAVLANVLLGVHRAWGPSLRAWSGPHAPIVVTGILVDQEDAAVACYPETTVDRRRRDGDWLGLVLVPAERP